MEPRSLLNPNASLVRYLGCRDEDELRPCGYCKGMRPGNSDYLMLTSNLSPIEYQILMDRGWRRSGSYCYVPVASVTCCPAYTIRCDSSALKLSRRQKRVIKSLNEFLMTGSKGCDKQNKRLSQTVAVDERIIIDDQRIAECPVNKYSMNIKASTSDESMKDGSLRTTNDDKACAITQVTAATTEKQRESSAVKNDLQGKQRQKAKYLRMEKSINKLMERRNCSFECAKRILQERRSARWKLKGHLEKSLEERMSLKETSRHQITIKFVSTSADAKYFQEKVLPIEHAIYLKYQCQIHQDPPDTCEVKQFKRFLVDSTLRYEPFNSDCPSPPAESLEISGYGSYHMQYWLDDCTLIAVSVIDITSYAFSSVYFFYDPDYTFLSPGTLSALYELRQVRALSQKLPHLKYYYMGYYIDSCQKMRYKKQFKPSFLLCPEAKTWHSIQDALPKLQVSKYSRLQEDLNVPDVDATVPFDHGQIQVTMRKKYRYDLREILSFIEREEHREELQKEIAEYVSLVGCNFAKSVVFFIPI